MYYLSKVFFLYKPKQFWLYFKNGKSKTKLSLIIPTCGSKELAVIKHNHCEYHCELLQVACLHSWFPVITDGATCRTNAHIGWESGNLRGHIVL